MRTHSKGLFRKAALALLLASGCASHDVNPSTPRANTGYVDFYTKSNLDLSWEVKWAENSSAEMRTAFSQFAPPKGNIVRLAAPPGTHRYQIWFVNEVTEPQTVLVHVEPGKVSPVQVTLTAAGATAVDNKSYEYRPTARATRRVTRITTEEQQVYKIGTTLEKPVDYQPKERMGYYTAPVRSPDK